MKDKLSYRQLYDEIETLNTSVFDSLINRDFESFQNTINEFVDSGIMEQDEFATATSAISSETPIKWDFFIGGKKVYNHFTTFKLSPDMVCHKKTAALPSYINLYDNEGDSA